MQGDEQVIEALNAGLTVELTAINLYFISSKMCKDWGLDRLAQHFYEESIEEMKHAEHFISDYGLFPFCRALLNANEFVYLM